MTFPSNVVIENQRAKNYINVNIIYILAMQYHENLEYSTLSSSANKRKYQFTLSLHQLIKEGSKQIFTEH